MSTRRWSGRRFEYFNTVLTVWGKIVPVAPSRVRGKINQPFLIIGEQDAPVDSIYVQTITISGGITNAVSGVAPVEDYHLATKAYVDANAGSGGGGAISGNIGLSGLLDVSATGWTSGLGIRFDGTSYLPQNYDDLYVAIGTADISGAANAEIINHLSQSDPHPQYLTQAEGDVLYGAGGFALSGTPFDEVSNHVGQADPHTQYLLETTAVTTYALSGTSLDEVNNHEGRTDPHPQYLTQSEADALYSTVSNIDDLNDVSPVSPISGQFLGYNGSEWVNADNATGGGGASELDDLTDVTIIPTPVSGMVLSYDGSRWTQSYPAAGGGSLTVTKESRYIGTTLVDLELSTTSGAIEFTVPGGYDRLEMRTRLRTDRASSTGDAVSLFYNNDATAANYRRSRIRNRSSILNAFAEDLNNVLNATASTAAAGRFSNGWVDLPFYTSEVHNKTAHIFNYRRSDPTQEDQDIFAYDWANTDPVESITIISSTASNFISGCRIQVVGYRSEDIVVDVSLT